MARAAVIEETKVPLRRVAALIGRQRVLRRRVCVCKIAVLIIGVVKQRRQRTVCAVRHARVGMAVHAHRGHRADDLRRALGGVNAAPLHAVGVFVRVLVAEALQHDFETLFEFCRDACAVDGIIHVRANGLHEHRDHIEAEAIGQILVRQNLFQQRLARPDRICGNGVVSHVQRDEREDRAVDGVATGVVVEDLYKVIDLIALGVDEWLTIVVLCEV